MSAKMARRRAQSRRKRAAVRRREDGLFFTHGTIPASATRVTICSCGARAFDRGSALDLHDDFDAMHAYCDEEWAP